MRHEIWFSDFELIAKYSQVSNIPAHLYQLPIYFQKLQACANDQIGLHDA